MNYAHTITVDQPFAAEVQATRDAFAGQDFGVIADFDIRSAFARKLDDDAAAELGAYLIRGACNPHLAQKALRDEPDLGLLLPCNVVIRRAPAAATVVQTIDPAAMTTLSASPTVAEVSSAADLRLRAALATITTVSTTAAFGSAGSQVDTAAEQLR